MFDNNFPSLVIYPEWCLINRSNNSCTESPMYVGPNFNITASTTFANYTADRNNTRWYFSSGYSFAAPLARDNVCIGDV